MTFKAFRSIALAFGLATAVGLAGCSSGEGESQPVAEPVEDNLELLLGGEPLDQVQLALNQLLNELLATSLPDEAGGRVVSELTAVVLQLVEAPDELLEALIMSGGLLAEGETTPAVYQMILSDAGSEILVHVQTAAFDLLAVLLGLAGNGAGEPVTGAITQLLAVTDLLNDPTAITDLSTLVDPLNNAVQALGLLDAVDLGVPEAGQQAVDTVLDMVTGSLGRVTELLAGLGDDESGAPVDVLLGPIQGLLDGLLGSVPSLQTVLAQLVDRTGFDPVTATLGLVGQLSSLLDANGVIDRVTALISPLVALLGPLTGRLSPVLCGLLRVCG